MRQAHRTLWTHDALVLNINQTTRSQSENKAPMAAKLGRNAQFPWEILIKLWCSEEREKVRADSLQKDLIPAFLYSCSLPISLLSSNSTAGKREAMTTLKRSIDIVCPDGGANSVVYLITKA